MYKYLLLFFIPLTIWVNAAFSSNALCTGSGCNGLDPHTTQCDQEAITWERRYITNGLIELRFSMICQTLWSRTTNQKGWHYAQATLAYWMWWENANIAFYFRNSPAPIGPGNVVYTAQYYDPAPEAAWNACGDLSSNYVDYAVLYPCTGH